jgi:hypothetical protein
MLQFYGRKETYLINWGKMIIKCEKLLTAKIKYAGKCVKLGEYSKNVSIRNFASKNVKKLIKQPASSGKNTHRKIRYNKNIKIFHEFSP